MRLAKPRGDRHLRLSSLFICLTLTCAGVAAFTRACYCVDGLPDAGVHLLLWSLACPVCFAATLSGLCGELSSGPRWFFPALIGGCLAGFMLWPLMLTGLVVFAILG